MQFTRIPENHAPLGRPLIYAVSCASASPADLEVCISDPAQRRIYGRKRFNAVTEAAFDVAPYLRRARSFAPSSGATGVYSAADRTLEAVVTVTDRTTQALLTAPVRCFLPTVDAPAEAQLLSAMPRVRLLRPGACDELTLYTAGAQPVTLTIRYAARTATARYTLPAAGLHLFRLRADDFPAAEVITLDAGACGTVTYSIVQPVEGAVRLAWRSRTGSIEHYDFPVERAAGCEAMRRTACGPEGYVSCTTVEWRRQLRSALERREVLEALAELIATPEVWLVEGERYTPVSVVSDRAEVHRYGCLSSLDLTIRPTQPAAAPWN